MTTTCGFVLVREQSIPELNSHARLFRHRKTGAELLSLENDDENKCFGMTFRTPPTGSTGVAHVLEHVVIAGSRKYPLKDPFAALLKGSLKTFLNALTFPDKTSYPVASQNLQDFYNLIDVYLDTVFYPLLRKQTFQQQGWRYELERLEDPLIIKGVVLNEMKGLYSSPASVLADLTRQSLFPDTGYGLAWGGDPKHIPDLTYEQLAAFHRLYYHPSNARAFFYGDDDPSERLRILDRYFADFAPVEIDSRIRLQPRFEAPRRIVYPYASSPNADNRKGMLNVAWMLDDTTNPERTVAFHILEHILIGTPASPLRKALIDSSLGEDLTRSGLTDALCQMIFSVGLKGVAVEHVDEIEDLILRTLEQLANEGIDALTVAAALNTIEFQLRENNSGPIPRGLSLMKRALTTWLYDGDPLAPLAFEVPLATIKARLGGGERLFEGLIERYFLHNPHRTTVYLQPDPDLGRREAADGRMRLDQVRAGMSTADLQAIIDSTDQLKRFQETPDSPEVQETIPSLKLTDLHPKLISVPLAVFEQSGARVLYHNIFTNGIVYLDVGLDLHQLPQHLLPYVPLFGRALVECGTTREHFVRLAQRVGSTTGGIRPQSFSSTIRETRQGTSWLFLRGKATLAHVADLIAIIQDMLLMVRLDDQQRFRQILLKEKASREAAIVPAGSMSVNTRLRGRFSEADWAAEQMSGVSYLFFLRQLIQQVESDWLSVRTALEQIHTTLVNRNAIVCNVTVDEAGWRQCAPRLDELLAALPAAPVEHVAWAPQYRIGCEGLAITADTNYVGKAANLYDLGYKPHGAASVVTRYLSTTWLWERVRVQGGAYSSFCTFDQHSGVFSYLSHRDPNLLATIDIYDQTSAFLRRTQFSDAELTRSIIGAIGDMNTYQLPDAKGYSSMLRYLAGETDAARQRWYDQILTTRAADFQTFADVLEQVRDKGVVVMLGGQAAINAAVAARPGWLEVIKLH
jgi:Zn-dependent M16 (insulinase) family peptidase